MKNKVYRKHDSFYANEVNDSPKQSFLSILGLIDKNTKSINGEVKILDIGCAIGEFPAFLNDKLDNRFLVWGRDDTGLRKLRHNVMENGLDDE